ncbi:MAG: FliM/FliN family flagellar motor switch protein [Gemmobacter sp.]
MQAIRRKIGAAVQVPAGRGAVAHWPLALARGAQGALGLDLVATDVQAGHATLAEVLERLPERALIAVVEGPGAGLGVLALSAEVLASLVEQVTLGRVTARPVAARRPTRTDAAMAQGLVDAVLGALDEALEGAEDRVWASGFRYVSYLDDPRPLGLMLEDAGFRLLRAEIALGGGMRSGQVALALPAQGRGTRPAPQVAVSETAAALVFQAAMAEQVMAAPAVLEAVLGRVVLPLGQVMALAPGEVLRLGGAALDRIDLEGPDGRRLTGGRLGQNRGMRAVRLAEGAAPAMRGEGGLEPGLAMVEEGMRRTGTQ